MKFLKTLILPTVVATSCLLSLGTSFANADNQSEQFIEVKADEPVNYDYIAWNTSNFYKIDGEDDFVTFKKSETFWDEKVPYGAIDDFRGWTDEGRTSVYKSIEWIQKSDKPYITFTLGGNKNNYVKIVYKQGEITAEQTVYPLEGRWMMIPRMVKTPDTISGDATVYLELHDVTTGDYGALTFGGLQANQSAEDAKQTIELWKKSQKVPNYNSNFYTNFYNDNINILNTNEEFQAARDAVFTETYFNEDFEASDWLLDWTLDYTYNNIASVSSVEDYPCKDYHWSDARSSASTHSNQNMPYNQTNNMYFHGFYDETNTGFYPNDDQIYRIISKAFVLSSDLISVKLSGNGAQLQLLDADTLEVLGAINNTAFKTSDNNDYSSIARDNLNTVTMTRYIANVSKFKNRTVRLGMVDSSTAGWGAINIDEIKTDYFDLSDFKFNVDTFTQNNSVAGTTYGQIADKYVDLSLDTSLTDIQSAYEYLQKHYEVLRSADKGINFCDTSYQTSDEVKALLKQFNELTDNAAAIVNRSIDYNHGASATSSDWYNNPTNTFEVWKTIDYLMKLNSMDNSHPYSTFTNVLANKVSNNTFMITSVIIALFAVLSIGGFLVFKRKRNEEKE